MQLGGSKYATVAVLGTTRGACNGRAGPGSPYLSQISIVIENISGRVIYTVVNVLCDKIVVK